MPYPKRYPDNAAKQRAYRNRQALERQNEQRLKGFPPAPPIPTMPAYRRWNAMIRQACDVLSTVSDEIDAYYNERTESWQESESGEASLERLDALKELLAQLEDLTT